MRDVNTSPDAAATAMIAALDGSPVTIAELGGDLRYTAVYSPGLLLAGHEAVGRSDVEIRGDQGEPLMRLARQSLASGQRQSAVVELGAGQAARRLEVRITPIVEGGGVARLALLATEAPQPSQRFLKQVVETTPAIVYVFDVTSASNIFVNGELLNILGYTPDQAHAMGDALISSLLHPDDRAEAAARGLELCGLADGASADWEYRMRHADGGWRWLLSRESIFARDELGAPTQVLGVALDITRRREAEDALRRSRDLLRTIFEGLSDGLLLLDRAGAVLLANPQASSLLALDDAPGPGIRTSSIAASLADGQAHSERLSVDTGGPRPRLLNVQTMPVRSEAGELEQLLVHVRDMTEQMQLEAQIIERERFAATGRLAATVAHEVNTPLQAIESCLHLAGRVADEAERVRYLRLAREEIQRVGYTLRQLLDLYRPSGSRVALDVNGLIERVLMLTSTSLARQSIQIERDLSSDLPALIGRADEITQVLINLVFNAMQAMPKGGRLRVESARAQGKAGQAVLCLRVRDSGAGIPPELHQRIFEPFFTTRPDGTGLGLAVCQRIIDDHGGSLRVESEPGAGSCFIIEIPRP